MKRKYKKRIKNNDFIEIFGLHAVKAALKNSKRIHQKLTISERLRAKFRNIENLKFKVNEVIFVHNNKSYNVWKPSYNINKKLWADSMAVSLPGLSLWHRCALRGCTAVLLMCCGCPLMVRAPWRPRSSPTPTRPPSTAQPLSTIAIGIPGYLNIW